MNNYQKLIVKFMLEKRKLVKDIITTQFTKNSLSIDIDFSTLYFCAEDAQAILNWSDKKAKHIWDTIEWNVLTKQHGHLDNKICPFCIATDNTCKGCAYKKNHGQCSIYKNSKYNDYKLLTSILYNCGADLDKRLSNNIYKKIINKLAKEEV